MALTQRTRDSSPAILTQLAETGSVSQVLAANRDAVVATDSDGQILWVNSAATSLFALEERDMLGRSIVDLRSSSPGMNDVAAAWINAEAGSLQRIRYRRGTGEEFVGETFVCEIKPSAERAAGAISIIRDVSKSKTLEAALTKFYQVSSDWSLSPGEKVNRILQIGCEHFGMSIGTASRVSGNVCVAEHIFSVDGDLALPPSPLMADSLFELTLQSEEPILIHDVANSSIAARSGNSVEPIAAYSGIRLDIEGRAGGVLAFRGPVRRATFGSGDAHLLKIMAVWIARELLFTRTYKKLHDEASTDWLTKAMTRRAFMPALASAVQDQVACSSGAVLIIADVDRFKDINDSLGHVAGDAVLRAIADRLRTVCRDGGVIGRLGGEEFGILIKHITLVQGLQIAERMREAIASSQFEVDGATVGVTCSFGVAALEKGLSCAEAWLKAADVQLYTAKERGRNRVEPGNIIDLSLDVCPYSESWGATGQVTCKLAMVFQDSLERGRAPACAVSSGSERPRRV